MPLNLSNHSSGSVPTGGPVLKTMIPNNRLPGWSTHGASHYSPYYKNITNLSVLAGEELRSTIFSPDGLLSLLLIGGPALALGTYGISKPKDRKEIEELKNGKS